MAIDRHQLELIKPVCWHFCIGGFRQREGDPSGILNLWLKLGRLRSPSTVVALREWNADWASVADLVFRATNGCDPLINVYAYSWGAGYGAMEFARELDLRGLRIQQMVLADPIYRSRWTLTRWLALRWWPVIHLPDNVDEVRSTYQRKNWPRAHPVVKQPGSKTIVHDPLYVSASHGWMDDHPLFHAMCLSAAGLGD